MLGQATDRPANTSSSHIRRGDLTYAALVGVRVLVARRVGRGRRITGRMYARGRHAAERASRELGFLG